MATPASLGASALRPATALGRRAERRARHALSGPARWIVLSTVDVLVAAVDAAAVSPVAKEAVERIRASAVADGMLEPLVGRALDSPEAARLVARVIDSRVVDAAVHELLESEALWELIDEIAQSPAVTDAISHQGFSFADQMADVVRDHSRSADDRLERLARRFTRRHGGVTTPLTDGAAPGN